MPQYKGHLYSTGMECVKPRSVQAHEGAQTLEGKIKRAQLERNSANEESSRRFQEFLANNASFKQEAETYVAQYKKKQSELSQLEKRFQLAYRTLLEREKYLEYSTKEVERLEKEFLRKQYRFLMNLKREKRNCFAKAPPGGGYAM